MSTLENLHSNKVTKLDNRKLYFDGDSVVDMDFLYDFLLSSKNIADYDLYVDKLSDEVNQYNDLFGDILKLKEGHNDYDYSWNIPEKFKKLNVKEFILKKLEKELVNNDFSDVDMIDRIKRTNKELTLWERKGMLNLLRTLIYIVKVFKKNDIVWGTGRGSSCCCYVLYLIELHDVDSILYDLDLKEFFR